MDRFCSLEEFRNSWYVIIACAPKHPPLIVSATNRKSVELLPSYASEGPVIDEPEDFDVE